MVRKKWPILLLCVCALCLMAAGCGAGGTASPESSSSEQGALQEDPGQEAASSASHGEVGTGVVQSGEDTVTAAGALVEIAGVGKTRISYTENQSSAAYVTSVSDLPDYEQLKQYDSAYFEEHALLVVVETVNSGTVDLGIAAVNVKGNVGTVTLYHELPAEGTYQTSDMATWLLWAEVETGLDGCRWTVANPALQSEQQTH